MAGKKGSNPQPKPKNRGGRGRRSRGIPRRLYLYACCCAWGTIPPFHASVDELEETLIMLQTIKASPDPEIPDKPWSIASPILICERLSGKAAQLARGGNPIVLGQTVSSSAIAGSMLDDGQVTAEEAARVAEIADGKDLAVDPSVAKSILNAAAADKDISLSEYSQLSPDKETETAMDNLLDMGRQIKAGFSGTGEKGGFVRAVGDFFGDIFKAGGVFGKRAGAG